MAGPHITDHALVRFLERAGGLDIEELRSELSTSLARAYAAARSVSESDFLIRADGLVYVVRGQNVVSIIDDRKPEQHGRITRGLKRP